VAPSVLRLDGPGLRAACTTRTGGVSSPPFDSLNLGLHVGDRSFDVLENRARVARLLGIDPRRLTFAEQVHGGEAALVGRHEAGRGALDHADALPGVDGLVTADAGIPLAILTADCVPVLLHDPEAGVLGVAHAGWRGLVAGIVEATVDAMVALGARAEAIRSALGPFIGPECFEVGEEVVEAVGEEFGVRRPGVRPRLDLGDAVGARLARRGVVAKLSPAACTACGPTPLFSYRRSNRTGRQALVAWLDGAAGRS
jgi:YfiH family protein